MRFHRYGVLLGCILGTTAACTTTTDGTMASPPLSDPLDAPDAFTSECTGASYDTCPGRVCLTLGENLEQRTGLCSARCSTDADCPAGACITLKNETIDAQACFRTCESNDDCNGLACVTDPESQRKVCSVRSGKIGSSCTDASECTERSAKCVETPIGNHCTGALDAPDLFDRECTKAEECPGILCFSLEPNEQGKAGICSMSCTNDSDCPGGDCVALPAGKGCLKRCDNDRECSNGFVCLLEPGSQRKVCGVTPR